MYIDDHNLSHGSVMPVAEPLAHVGRPDLDFGPGFYLTNDREQAIEWATTKAIPTPSPHRLQLGLPGYLIRFAPLAFVPHRQNRSSQTPSPQAVLPGLQNFTSTLVVPLTSPDLKSNSISSNSHS